jgi:hypothetical protein
MKKLSITLALVITVGAGVAFASSLCIPWFVDNSPNAVGWPPTSGNTTLAYLKNTTSDDLECEIAYYSATGQSLGPAIGANTFIIPALSTVAFRPVANDPVSAGGQEADDTGNKVPDRPRDVNPAKNGSATVSWTGGVYDVQGMVATAGPNISYAHLIPPGKPAE